MGQRNLGRGCRAQSGGHARNNFIFDAGPAEIRRFAREGFNSIPPEWIGTYFRWWGVYTQGDGAGVTGGQGGEGRALQCFMVRIRIPNGMLTSPQLRAIADLTRR